MMHSTATVATPKASRYIQQLCKHFQHKITVDFDATRARADFPWGVCTMQADAAALSFRLEAADAESLSRIEYVVADHLTRFAWKEGLQVDWQRSHA